jgi:pyruvate,water dikinase
MISARDVVVWLGKIDIEDAHITGEEIARLGQMTQMGFPLVSGFVITPYAYNQFIKENNIDTKIRHLLGTIHPTSHDSLLQGSAAIRNLIHTARIPEHLVSTLFTSYEQVGGVLRESDVLLTPFFVGKGHNTQKMPAMLMHGEAELIDAVRRIWASYFTPRTVSQLVSQKNRVFPQPVLLIQKNSNALVSGCIETQDPETNDKNIMKIHAMFGVYQPSHKGLADRYILDKKTGDMKISHMGRQTQYMVDAHTSKRVPFLLKHKRKMTDGQVRAVVGFAKKIEEYLYFPQSIQFAFEKDRLVITHIRHLENNTPEKNQTNTKPGYKKPLVIGEPIFPGIASGHITILTKQKEPIKTGDIVVIAGHMNNERKQLRAASGIIIEGKTIDKDLIKTLGIPAIQTVNAVSFLKNGMAVTLNGKTGEVHKGGQFGHSVIAPQEEKVWPTKTKLYTVIHDLAESKEVAQQYVDGVLYNGSELIIETMGKHPVKIFEDKKHKSFISEVSTSLQETALAFYPRPVLFQHAELSVGEYRNLSGGKDHEPLAKNPLLSLTHASRVLADPRLFMAELESIKQVREKKKLNNIWLMLPAPRSLWELQQLKKLVSSTGLRRSSTFKIILPVVFPAVALGIEEYVNLGVDGVLIRPFELTRLMQGVDPEDHEMLPLFHEDDPVLMSLYTNVVKICKKNNILSLAEDREDAVFLSLFEHLYETKIDIVIARPEKLTLAREYMYKKEGKK